MDAQINGLTLAYTDEGKGMPVVFVHGFPLNRNMWAPQVQALSRQHRVITVDLRGHGESGAPLWRYTMEQFADDLTGVLDHLSIQQAVMAGLSMGGYILFAFYRKYATRVNALILSDTRAQPDTDEGRAGRFNMAQSAYTQGSGAIADVMLSKLLCPASLHTRPELVQQVRGMITAMTLGGMAGDLMGMADRPDSVPLLSTIACPTLIIVGELDLATPPSDAHLMSEQIPGAQLKIIPGAAHLPNLEQPEAFNDAVRSFLASIA
ncbi:MAG: alpha/beta fold hydrolase [Nitrospirota bacterium]|nr:alpha/beta fold hydrolase [Nitrospirota bacterium]